MLVDRVKTVQGEVRALDVVEQGIQGSQDSILRETPKGSGRAIEIGVYDDRYDESQASSGDEGEKRGRSSFISILLIAIDEDA